MCVITTEYGDMALSSGGGDDDGMGFLIDWAY
jgi:hypothetical protein